MLATHAHACNHRRIKSQKGRQRSSLIFGYFMEVEGEGWVIV